MDTGYPAIIENDEEVKVFGPRESPEKIGAPGEGGDSEPTAPESEPLSPHSLPHQ